MSVISQIRSNIVGILVLALIVSVGLNFYERFFILPQIEAITNNIRTETLQEWLSQLRVAKYILNRAETNFDVQDAAFYTSMAKKLAQIFLTGIEKDPENFHYWLGASTNRLELALEVINRGNSSVLATVSRNLDGYILQKIENITQTIENIENSMIISTNGVDPVRQLREKGNLTRIVDYLKQISEMYMEIVAYY